MSAPIQGILGILAAFAAVEGFTVYTKAASAMHQIYAGVLLVAFAVSVGAIGIISAVRTPVPQAQPTHDTDKTGANIPS